MLAALRTTVTELPESRVRVEVQVPASELEQRIEHKARQLGHQLKLPGFRKGKVPGPLVIQRVGREVVLGEAVRDTLSSWYADAIATAGIVPVGDPQVDLQDLPEQGAALEFSIEVGVLPTAKLGDYKGLEVGRREPVVEEEGVRQEIEALRERLARLEPAPRPAGSGDFVVVDYMGSIDGKPFKGGEGRDQVVELGSGNLLEGFEEGLLGASAGETRTIELSFPADYSDRKLAARRALLEVTVKQVKRKELPEIDEDLAVALGFDSVEQLGEDIRDRLRVAEQLRVDAEFREAALDAAVAQAEVQAPAALVEAKAQEMWERVLHSLADRGISREAYLQMAGRGEDELRAELVPQAGQALRREAVISAVVSAEAIAPSDDELLVAIAPAAEREGAAPEKLLEDLRSSGRLEEVREDLAARQAVELIAAQARAIPIEQAHAREKLWTPEKAQMQEATVAGAGGGLWTPDR